MSKELVIRKGSLTRNTVVMGNPLIESAYSLSNLEQRIVSLMVSQIDDKRDDERYIYEFTVKELSKVLGFEKNKDQYKRIDQIFDSLSQRNIRIDPKYSTDGSKTFCNWGVFKYWPGQGRVSIIIAEDIAPFLLQLKGNWTKYRLEEVLKFRGEYTIRFFQWFMQERNKPSQAKRAQSGAWYLRMSLTAIRNRLEMFDKDNKIIKYPRWPDFRRRVLEPSEKEISEKSSIVVSWEAIKEGRAVKEVIFHCTPKRQEPTLNLSQLDNVQKPQRQVEVDRTNFLLELLETVSPEIQQKFKERKADILRDLQQKQEGQPIKTQLETLKMLAIEGTLEELGSEIENQSIMS